MQISAKFLNLALATSTMLVGCNAIDMIRPNESDTPHLSELIIKHIHDSKRLQDILYVIDVRQSLKRVQDYDNLLRTFHESNDRSLIMHVSKGTKRKPIRYLTGDCVNYVIFDEELDFPKTIRKFTRENIWKPRAVVVFVVWQAESDRSPRKDLTEFLSRFYIDILVEPSIYIIRIETDGFMKVESASKRMESLERGDLMPIGREQRRSSKFQLKKIS